MFFRLTISWKHDAVRRPHLCWYQSEFSLWFRVYRSMSLHSSSETVIELNMSETDFFNEASSKHLYLSEYKAVRGSGSDFSSWSVLVTSPRGERSTGVGEGWDGLLGVMSSIQGLVNDSLVLHVSLTIVKRQALGRSNICITWLACPTPNVKSSIGSQHGVCYGFEAPPLPVVHHSFHPSSVIVYDNVCQWHTYGLNRIACTAI